jgi:hypothetical protein
LSARSRLLERQITGTASQVEHPVPGSQAAHFEREAFPQAVNAERHDVVHQVVFLRHRSENLSDTTLFFGSRDLFVAEVCRAVLLHDSNHNR